MNDSAHREILWNVNSLWGVVLMYTLMLLSLIVAGAGLLARLELWSSGRPAQDRRGNWFMRLFDLLWLGIFQRGVVRDLGPGLWHTLIYAGFLTLLFTTSMVFIDHDLGIKIYQGDFYLALTLASDLLGFAFLVGLGLAAHRRYIAKADRVHNRKADGFFLGILSLLILQGFLLEGLRIHVTHDAWAAYSPIGLLVSNLIWPLSEDASRAIHFFTWWFHTLTVFTLIGLLPYTKFFHVLASLLNLFFKRSAKPKGALLFEGDLEKMMEAGEEFSFGLGTIKDYSWKQLMDLDACTSCGRCQDACPAYASGKPLSPKWVVLDTRNHMLALHSMQNGHETKLPKALSNLDKKLTSALLLDSSGLNFDGDDGYSYEKGFRAANSLVEQSARVLGKKADARIAGEVMNPDTFWSCTTCMACVEACPVGINHVDQIIGNRRNMSLMHGEIPSEVQPTLKALENRANPYGAPQDRANWLKDLNVPILKPGDKVDYLYWVGCVSAFDPRKQKIASSLVKIMKAAGLSFGVLGNAEGCSGDPARRLGEENLFQTLAKKNIETLKSVSFKFLVANCPHCFNTIQNEYPQFGNLSDGEKPKIIHHSQLLRELLQSKKLQMKEGAMQEFTFHDPCYLGRYNDEYEAPRSALRQVPGLKILEMERTKEKAMCCGAGGGHFWMDMKVGQRVNVLRTDQAAASGASNIATACPFCMQMMEDGVKLTGRDEKMAVKDIAEVIAESLKPL